MSLSIVLPSDQMMANQFSHTTVQCLTAIAQHHGLQINPEQLIHEYALADEEPTLPLVFA